MPAASRPLRRLAHSRERSALASASSRWPSHSAIADPMCSAVKEWKGCFFALWELEELGEVAPGRLKLTEREPYDHPPTSCLGLDIAVAQFVPQAQRLGEHFEDLLERARAATRVGACEQGRQHSLVAEPARHLDRIRADDRGAGLVPTIGEYAGKARQQTDPERRFRAAKGGARLLEQLQGRAVGAALAPAGVLQSDSGTCEHVRVTGLPADLRGRGERLHRVPPTAGEVAAGPELELDLPFALRES